MRMESSMEHELLLNIAVIGESSVGKSALLYRLQYGIFNVNIDLTIGADLFKRVLIIDGKRVKVRIWDTAGQERFRSLTSAFYKNVDGIIFVCDVTKMSTLDSLQDVWIKEVERNSDNELQLKALICNKIDLVDGSTLSSNVSFRAKQLAVEEDAIYGETSAISGAGVDEIFTQLAERIIKQKFYSNVNNYNSLRRGVRLTQKEVPNSKCC